MARRLAMTSGFHGKLRGDCSGCHPDHGPRLITMDDREFNHDLALFRLEGAHRDLDCDQCHERDSAGETATRRYLDIAHDDCGDCHADPHDPPLEPACAHCHRQDTWSDLQAAFAHDRDTSFALDTAHRSVDCSGCHRRESEQGPPRLTGTPTACQEWSGPEGAAASPSPHYREVECAECHRAGSREEIARCRDCHPADYDRLFVDWQARVELELLGVADASEAARWRRRGKHHWEAVVDRLRRRHRR